MKGLKIVILVIMSVVSFTSIINAEEKPEVKIGSLLSASGGLEQWCSYIQQGAEIAGREDFPVKANIIYEDDHSLDKRITTTAAQRLVQVKKVDLLFTWTAAIAPVLSPIATKAKTPLVVGAYDIKIAHAGPYVFGGFVNYELLPREIAKFLVNKKGNKRLGMVLAQDEWSQNFEKPFRDEVEKLGGIIVFSETVQTTETDARSLIVRINKEKADAVLAPLYGPSLYAFLKEAHEMQYHGAIHVGDGMFEEDIKTVGTAAEGVYSSQIWIESEELSKKIKEAYGKDINPVQLGLVATGYDAMRHIQNGAKELIQEGKTISRETLQQKLKTFRSVGYLGDQMYGAAPTHSGEVSLVVKDMKYVLAE